MQATKWLALLYAVRRLQHAVRGIVLEGAHVNKSQLFTMMTLRYKGIRELPPPEGIDPYEPMTLSGLAREMGQTTPALSQRITQLEEMGYVGGSPGSRGGRTVCGTACRQEKVNWGCPDCGWESGWLEDSRLLWQITALLNRLIQEPALAIGAASKGDTLSVDAMRLAREINRKLGDPKANDGELLQLIQQCAQEKYRVCTANGWETQSLAKHLAGQQPGETLDTALFEKIVKSVQISGWQISLQLVNGVILT